MATFPYLIGWIRTKNFFFFLLKFIIIFLKNKKKHNVSHYWLFHSLYHIYKRLKITCVNCTLKLRYPVFEIFETIKPLNFILSLIRSEEHTSELQSLAYLVCRLLLEKKKNNDI